MISHVAHYFAAVAIILSHSTIVSVKGQCTVEGCENGDPLMSIVAEIQQLRLELFDHVNKQVQNIHELLIASFQQMTSQHDTVIRSLRAVDRLSEEHDIHGKQIQNIQDLLNETFQEMKSLQAVDRRSHEHDIYMYIKQSQNIHEFLNESFQEMKSQHGTVTRNLQAVDRRLKEHDMTIKVRTQNLWKLANGSCESESQVWDCSDLKASGLTANGVYEVCVRHQLDQLCTNAFCDMEAANGASLVFQRRKDGSLNFNRTWTEYKQGFGNPDGEFWLGNEMLYLLTSKRNYKLRVDLEDFHGNKSFAEYSRFSINTSADNYRITVRGYSGNAGDSLDYSHGKQFSTEDVDNDDYGGANCARTYGGAWWNWHGSCSYATLNGKYYHRYESVNYNKGIHWYHWHNGMHNSLKGTEMKLVPVA